MNRKQEYEKAIKVFRSCKTREQLESACAFGALYVAKYAPNSLAELNRFNKLYAFQYCKLGLHKNDPVEGEDV